MVSIFRCHLETKRGLKSLVLAVMKTNVPNSRVARCTTCPLTMTGFKVELKADGSQGHGYSLTHESDWCFIPKDKNVSNWTSGNICRDLALHMTNVEFLPGVDWLWRFQWDPIHGKLTTKKPFLMLTQCLT